MAKKLTPSEFNQISKYIFELSGIVLSKGKEYLVETRLTPLLQEFDCPSFSSLYQKSKTDRTKTIEKKIIDGISTNETYFFRDNMPFELLKNKLIPDIIDARSAKFKGKKPIPLKIWSAACSTGQELYSIAITVKEILSNLNNYNIKLLGTDLSSAAVSKASYAKYNKFEIARGLTNRHRQKYFKQDKDAWKIQDEIRAMAAFRKINLQEPFVGIGKFDIIFFRNVAIYFSNEDRKKIYANIAKVLEPDGYLLIGSTESLSNDTNMFQPKKYLNTICYQLKC
jgi:chemotaxis protein methyltransferase CheR